MLKYFQMHDVNRMTMKMLAKINTVIIFSKNTWKVHPIIVELSYAIKVTQLENPIAFTPKGQPQMRNCERWSKVNSGQVPTCETAHSW